MPLLYKFWEKNINENWEDIKLKGKTNFIIFKGVFGIGLFIGIFISSLIGITQYILGDFDLFQFLIEFAIFFPCFLLIGYYYGKKYWENMERKNHKNYTSV